MGIVLKFPAGAFYIKQVRDMVRPIKPVKILVFTEGTIIMHKSAVGRGREQIVKQSEKEQESVHDYASYVPVGNAPKKLNVWKKQGAKILYLTSRKMPEEIKQIKAVLKKHGFPGGRLLFRQKYEGYKDVAERVVPDILVEDDCESIGGADEMTITHIRPEIKKKIKSMVIKEFGGIDNLPDHVAGMANVRRYTISSQIVSAPSLSRTGRRTQRA